MVSSSALRFYDEIGLLKPCSTDSWNGYRYYSEEQVGDILFISEMREYGFSLEEIKALMNDNNIVERSLREKYDKLFWEEQKITYIRRKLKMRINNLKGEGDFMNKVNQEKMEVKVANKEEDIKAVGISVLVPKWPPENPSIFGDLWTRYWDENISEKVPNKKYPSVRYGILSFNEGSIYYIVADEVTSYDNIPDGFTKFDIPKGKYAVCTFNGNTFDELVNNSLQKANDHLLTTWLPSTDYKHAGTFSVEVYDDRSKKKEYPEMDIYQPIIEAESV